MSILIVPGPCPKTSLEVYYSSKVNRDLNPHYIEYFADDQALMLVFEGDWARRFLPVWDPRTNPLTVVLLDTEDGGKLYRVRHCAAYEEQYDGVLSLHGYFYLLHFCQCHRKSAAESAGVDTDGECEGRRFVVERIECPTLPGLILYSEVYTLEQLEMTICLR